MLVVAFDISKKSAGNRTKVHKLVRLLNSIEDFFCIFFLTKHELVNRIFGVFD